MPDQTKAPRELWAEALRSGEFQQGRGTLREDNEHYCCLGVLCEVYRRETGEGEWRKEENGWYFHLLEESSKSLAPIKVAAWAGFMPNAGGDLEHPQTYLSSPNDAGATFATIADIIEMQEHLAADTLEAFAAEYDQNEEDYNGSVG